MQRAALPAVMAGPPSQGITVSGCMVCIPDSVFPISRFTRSYAGIEGVSSYLCLTSPSDMVPGTKNFFFSISGRFERGAWQPSNPTGFQYDEATCLLGNHRHPVRIFASNKLCQALHGMEPESLSRNSEHLTDYHRNISNHKSAYSNATILYICP